MECGDPFLWIPTTWKNGKGREETFETLDQNNMKKKDEIPNCYLKLS